MTRNPRQWTLDLILPDPAVELLGSTTAKVLRALRDFEPVNVATAAHHAGVTPRRVRAALNRLAASGIAQKPAEYYWINRSYMLTEPILQALDARQSVLHRIAALATDMDALLSVAVYAHTDPETVGILVVHQPADRHPADNLAQVYRSIVPRMTGRKTHVEVLSAAQLTAPTNDLHDVMVEQWWRSFTVTGPNIAELLLNAERSRH